MDCVSGSGKCTSLYAIYGLANVEIDVGQLPDVHAPGRDRPAMRRRARC